MDFFEAVQRRRSIRKYTQDEVSAEIIYKAIDAGFLAPNSSNMQTCQVYWVRSNDKKKQLVSACLSQTAARTARELLVVVADRGLWNQNRKKILKAIAPDNRQLKNYYDKIIPFTYGSAWLTPLKWLIFNVAGLFKPMIRRPYSPRDVSEICIKSAALVSENIMLALSAMSYDSCPMEGFDEARIKKLLKLPWSARVVMVISVGKRAEDGIWGEQLRFPRNETFFEL